MIQPIPQGRTPDRVVEQIVDASVRQIREKVANVIPQESFIVVRAECAPLVHSASMLRFDGCC